METIAKSTLLIGWGNPDREDDGVAWHVLKAAAAQLGLPCPENPEDGFAEPNGRLDLIFDLQLTPELAETAAQYERVCFIDAHTGSVPDEVNVRPVLGAFQNSPFTHHMTPDTCIALAQSLYNAAPEALLVSVRGYAFGFERSLSAQTAALVERAAGVVCEWVRR